MASMLTLGGAVFFWMCACAFVLRGRRELFQFDRSATVPLRGLMVLLVVFAHLTIRGIDPAGVFGWFMWQNAAVAVFFFMSGYGQMCALKSRPGYLRGMIGRTMRKLFVPFMILLSCVIAEEFIIREGLDFGRMFARSKSGDFLLVPHSWYVVVLVILTIAFSCFARMMKGGHLILVICAVILGLGGLFKVGLHLPRWWWLSLHAYPIGMAFCCYEERIRLVIEKKTWMYVAAGLFFFAVCILTGVFRFNAIEAVMRGMIGPIVALGFYVLPIPRGCRILSFIGMISLELYLCHGAVRNWMLNASPDGMRTVVGLTSVGVAVLVAWLVHKLAGRMNNWGLKHV